jgi:hypothetical protein
LKKFVAVKLEAIGDVAKLAAMSSGLALTNAASRFASIVNGEEAGSAN